MSSWSLSAGTNALKKSSICRHAPGAPAPTTPSRLKPCNPRRNVPSSTSPPSLHATVRSFKTRSAHSLNVPATSAKAFAASTAKGSSACPRSVPSIAFLNVAHTAATTPTASCASISTGPSSSPVTFPVTRSAKLAKAAGPLARSKASNPCGSSVRCNRYGSMNRVVSDRDAWSGHIAPGAAWCDKSLGRMESMRDACGSGSSARNDPTARVTANRVSGSPVTSVPSSNTFSRYSRSKPAVSHSALTALCAVSADNRQTPSSDSSAA
mmetsp:Transcript_11915/g.32972  ORF Transcript_11915/g.32972 Transcript_11915/m.32972 type:complete len:267 (+) Transcript_11915:245-1045(+)